MIPGCLFTLLDLTAGILTTTSISVSQTAELGNVERKSRMLNSINGFSGTIVKCSNVSLNAFLFVLPLLGLSTKIRCTLTFLVEERPITVICAC